MVRRLRAWRACAIVDLGGIGADDRHEQSREAYIHLGPTRMVPHLHAVSLASDQSGLAQNPEVIGQGRFWNDAVTQRGNC